RYIPNANSPEAEKPILNEWIREKAGDPKYLFGRGNSFDPSDQTESVGDDPVKASTYALANLKIVAKNLDEWTATPGEDYTDLEELYGELFGVWSRFANHVVTNIGGVYEQLKTTDQEGVTYTPIVKSEQVKAMNFLNEEVFSTPDWLLQEEILSNIGASGAVSSVSSLQSRILANVLRMDRLKRLIDNEALNGAEAYTLTQMLGDLRKGIWSELSSSKNIDAFRRNLQRAHVEQLASLMTQDEKNRSDVSASVRAELKTIQTSARSASSRYSAGIVQNHLRDIDAYVDSLLDTQ
ncbi:MAG: zinc-dependent metalloprotease, partial [Algoriphagus sp.]